jgi:hypothetical protein
MNHETEIEMQQNNSAKKIEEKAAANERTTPAPVRFQLGRTLVTRGALEALEEAGETGREYLRRHASGDWGIVCAEDKEENELSVREGFRILSAYQTAKGEKIWADHRGGQVGDNDTVAE